MLFATKSVRVKLLPFDNKSEIAVVVDLPRGASLEETDRLLTGAAERLKDLPELTSIQSYTGTAAPFNFNGLVRHYYMREAPEMGDLSVNLLPKEQRKRASHAIALDIRKRLETLSRPEHTAIKVVELPPGPPFSRHCSPRSMGRMQTRGARSPQKYERPFPRSISSSIQTIASACAVSACAIPSIRRRLNIMASRKKRFMTRLARWSAA